MSMLNPQKSAQTSAEIRKSCMEDDLYGIFHESAWWWYERKTCDLHILAGEAEQLPCQTMQNISQVLSAETVRNLIIHEGLEDFPIDFLPWYYDDPEIEELILPGSIRKLPRIKGKIKKMKVPPTVECMKFDDLFVDCDSHWEPVTYAVKQLILPSGISFDHVEDEYDRGSLPTCEPISYWEEVVIYGEEKIPDLLPWYNAKLFLKGFTVYYPKAWDDGKDGSYADEILTFIKEQQPTLPRFGMAPAGRDPYTETDYQRIRERLIPYEAN